MDAVLLARIQFAMTVGFHFIFPPITIGLAWIIFILELQGFKKKEEVYVKLGKFFGKLLAITFAVGVATGVVMEFQFGTNWSQYSRFVGDIFGAPLAAEAIFAFFLESGFIGLYLFGRNRVSKGVHLFSSLMIAIGSTISAFWIIVANSWQQTPAGFIIHNGRAELVDFWAAIFNPSTFVRFSHTFLATLITGAFFVAGVSAYLILKKKEVETMKKSLKIAIIFGCIVSLLELIPSGHHHAKQVALTQPAKFAAIEGIYQGRTNAPLIAFGIPADNPSRLIIPIEIPGLVSYMVYGDVNAYVKGLNDFLPDETPPIFLTFISFHTMVALGSYFILITFLGLFFLYKKKLYENKKYLKVMAWSIPLPIIACQLGWIAAEVGRQPWIVYGLLRTKDAASVTVPAEQILISLILFGIIYLLLGALYLYILIKEIKHGPEPVSTKEVYK
jgi:cytochrome bd ubiquinol oxidase subunit I